MCNEGCFTFNIHHITFIASKISSLLPKEFDKNSW